MEQQQQKVLKESKIASIINAILSIFYNIILIPFVLFAIIFLIPDIKDVLGGKGLGNGLETFLLPLNLLLAILLLAIGGLSIVSNIISLIKIPQVIVEKGYSQELFDKVCSSTKKEKQAVVIVPIAILLLLVVFGIILIFEPFIKISLYIGIIIVCIDFITKIISASIVQKVARKRLLIEKEKLDKQEQEKQVEEQAE